MIVSRLVSSPIDENRLAAPFLSRGAPPEDLQDHWAIPLVTPERRPTPISPSITSNPAFEDHQQTYHSGSSSLLPDGSSICLWTLSHDKQAATDIPSVHVHALDSHSDLSITERKLGDTRLPNSTDSNSTEKILFQRSEVRD